jgi:hypothetical protein
VGFVGDVVSDAQKKPVYRVGGDGRILGCNQSVPPAADRNRRATDGAGASEDSGERALAQLVQQERDYGSLTWFKAPKEKKQA